MHPEELFPDVQGQDAETYATITLDADYLYTLANWARKHSANGVLKLHVAKDRPVVATGDLEEGRQPWRALIMPITKENS